MKLKELAYVYYGKIRVTNYQEVWNGSSKTIAEDTFCLLFDEREVESIFPDFDDKYAIIVCVKEL